MVKLLDYYYYINNTATNRDNEMNQIKHISTDQNYQDETTNYWFEVNSESWAVSDCNGDIRLLDCDGCPVESCNDHDGVLDELMPHYEIERDFI